MAEVEFLIDQYRMLGWVLLTCWVGIALMLLRKDEEGFISLPEIFKMRALGGIGLFCMFIGLWLTTRGGY